MRKMTGLLLALALLAACAAPAEEETPGPPPREGEAALKEEPKEDAVPPEPGAAEETEDHVLLTLEAPLADGRALTLEAVGKRTDEYGFGVREVRVYDGGTLIQTIQAREGNEAFWGDSDGGAVSEYTSCPAKEGVMEALDLNFDGNTDLGLFAFLPNNNPPYFYWTWDAEAGRYQYAFTLQGAAADPEAGELSAAYKNGPGEYCKEYYRPGGDGDLFLDRVEVDNWEASGLDDRAAHEIWVPPEGGEPIRPGDSWSREADLVLVRREVPVREFDSGGAVSNYTEIWELRDGEFQMTGREEWG